VVIARLREDVPVDPRILNLDVPKGLDSKPAIDQAVVTYAFDGTRKDGTVIAAGIPIPVEIAFPTGKSKVKVDLAVTTTVISSGAEIGGPVVTADGKLIGMIFATGGPSTLVVPVEPVLKELKLELVK
jgi:hypothetical protein